MPEDKKQRRSALDPAVADLLKGMQQKQSEAQLPRRERERISRERAKIQARRDQRATYDLPPSIREGLRLLAGRVTSSSQPACYPGVGALPARVSPRLGGSGEI